MYKWMLAALVATIGLTSSGCALCSAPDDGAYGAYGGVFERSDRCCGRVFSAFQPAGVIVESDAEGVELQAPVTPEAEVVEPTLAEPPGSEEPESTTPAT